MFSKVVGADARRTRRNHKRNFARLTSQFGAAFCPDFLLQNGLFGYHSSWYIGNCANSDSFSSVVPPARDLSEKRVRTQSEQNLAPSLLGRSPVERTIFAYKDGIQGLLYDFERFLS